jgi:arylformamidase
MHIYDVSLPISPELPTWPGDPTITIERVSKMEKGEVVNVTRLAIGAHTGTHIDAPWHFLKNGSLVEDISLKVLTGRVYVLELPSVDLITAKVLEEAEIPPRTRRIIFKTTNSQLWHRTPPRFHTDFVAVSADGAQYLVNRGVKLIGIDYFSIAPFDNLVDTHQILLQAGTVIVEGLDMTEVSQGRYTLYCLPLNLIGVEGAPARAILIGV